jgi:hypothetical protein
MFSRTEESPVKKTTLLIALTLIALLVALAGCGEKATTTTNGGSEEASAKQAEAAAPSAGANAWNGAVVETMDAGGYTYVLLDTGSEKIWAAAPATAVKVGQRVTVPKGMMMSNFPSKTLDRTFEEIYFVGGIYPEGTMPLASGMGSMPQGDEHPGGDSEHPGATGEHPGATGEHPGAGSTSGTVSGTSTVVEDAHIEGVTKAAGGYTVAEIIAQSEALNGKMVKVRGRVVKFTGNIMGTNWVHLQDGSGEDLTITTPAVVATGDLILVEGKLAANRDFGAGYEYVAIIEKAVVTKE